MWSRILEEDILLLELNGLRKLLCGRSKCVTQYVFVIASIFLFPHGLLAQTGNSSAGTNVDQNNPLGPGTPDKPADIWNLDPISGSVHIQIPLGTIPTGGRGPRVRPILQYNSNSTITLSSPRSSVVEVNQAIIDGQWDPGGGNNNTYTYSFSWISPDYADYSSSDGHRNNPGDAPIGPWTTTYGPSIFYPTSYDGGPGTECTVITPFLADAEGQVHDLGLSDAYGTGTPDTYSYVCPSNLGEVYAGGTSDGSNIVAVTTDQALTQTLGPYMPNGPGSLNPLLLPDGSMIMPSTQMNIGVYYSSAAIEDSNGNIFSASGVDSEGRTAASFRLGAQDVSPGTYTATTLDQSGNSENYTITVNQTSFSGGFTMSHPTATSQDIWIAGGAVGFTVNQPGCCGSQLFAYQVSSLQLPNSTSYQFTYDPTYGTIAKIVFPSGGYVRFQWAVRNVGTMTSGQSLGFNEESTLVATDAYVSPSGASADEQHWQYVYKDMAANTNYLVTTETDPTGTQTVYTAAPYISGYPDGNYPISFKEISRQISDSNGNAVLSVATSYNAATWRNGPGIKPVQVATTYFQANGQVQQQTLYSYDNYLNEIEKDESAFYSCTSPCTPPATPTNGWLRKTFTSYQYQNSTAWVTANIINKPSQVLVTDGGGIPYSLTQYGYDETAVGGKAGYLNHDDTNYGTNSTLPRGNLTTESHCATLSNSNAVTPANASAVCSAWLKTIRTYDLAGQILSVTDPNKNETTFDYTDKFAAGSGTPPVDGGGNPAPTDAYPTTVTNALNYSDYYTYYYDSGQLATHKDLNSNTTQYFYNDPGLMSRPTSVSYPDGGGYSVTYNDVSSPTVTATTALGNGAGSLVDTTQYDGLARATQTQLTSDPEGTDYVDTTYDGVGRVYTVSNPYRTKTDPTYGLTTYTYDALGRKVAQQNSDGKTWRYWCYDDVKNASQNNCQGVAGSLTSPTWIDSADENGNDTQSASDALGRMVQVEEPGSILTAYNYDPLGNLIGVSQNGNSSNGDVARGRNFTYDAMSRLITANNPETGTICYGQWSSSNQCVGGYDGNGNLLYKTDARNLTIWYFYDALNRMIQKKSPISTSPTNFVSTCYQYDSLSIPGMTTVNPIGHLTAEWTQNGSSCASSYTATVALTAKLMPSYDAMGRLLSSTQCVKAMCQAVPFTQNQTYDLAGNMTSWTDGMRMTFNQQFDAAEHVISLENIIAGSAVSPVIFSAQGYSPAGSLLNWNVGDYLNFSRSYDNRLRVTSEAVTH